MHLFKFLFISVVAAVLSCSLSAQNLPQTFTHSLSNGNESYTINFSRFSSRGPLFEIAVQQANGSFQTVNVGEPRTYIGTVVGQPGAVAACVRRTNGEIFTRMTFENGFEWIDYDGDLTIEERELTPSWPTFGLREGAAGDTLYAADIFVDLTNRYYGTVGGTPEDCADMVDFSFTAINLIYLRDMNVLNRIGRVQIRAVRDHDPYRDEGGSTMTNLLNTLRTQDDQWVNGPNPNTDHDLATVIQSLAGGGLAGVGVIGTGSSANGAFTTGDFTSPARHEFGHNWGMNHFEGRGDGEPISPEGRTIMSGNGLAKMSSPELEAGLQERDDAISVLTNLGTSAPNMPPRAGDDRLIIDNVFPGQTLSVQPLVNDNDSNGDAINIISVDSTTLRGASVSRSNNIVNISFPNNYSFGYDNFRYRISDSTGRTSTAVVHLQMSNPTMDWEVAPAPLDGNRLLMIASDKFEGNGAIEYLFDHVNGSRDSNWQTSRTYIASSLSTGQAQTFRVFARLRDSSTSSEPSQSISATPVDLSEGLLFADNFNRSSLNDNGGQSGEVAPLDYTLTTFGNVTAGVISNQLHIDGPAASGSFGGLVYLDEFNLGSPVMEPFDEVSIKIDIAGYTTVGSGRQMTLGVGQSLNELQDQPGVFPSESAADLLVAYRDTTNTLEIYKNGVLINSETIVGNLPNDPTEMKLVYSSPNLREGTTVSYEVFFDENNNPHTSGTFRWSGDYQNYLSLSANLSGDALFDNLEINIEGSPGSTAFTPDPNAVYHIENPAHGLRLAATGNSEDAYTTNLSVNNDDTRWRFVQSSTNGLWHIQRAAGGNTPRLRTDLSINPDMQATSSSGDWTQFSITESPTAGTYLLTVPNAGTSLQRFRILSNGSLDFATNNNVGSNPSLRFVEADSAQPVFPSLVAHWAMNETSGSAVSDSSGNGFNASLSNASRVSGYANGGLQFNGSSSQVSIPAAAFDGIDDEVTISMWINGGAGQARNDTVFRALNSSGDRILNIHLPWGNSQVYWDAGYSSGSYDRINKTAAAADFKGQWNHWTFSKNSNSGQMAVYLNGSLWHSGTGKTKPMTGISAVALGSAINTSYYEGIIDEVIIFDSSLSASEVAEVYSSSALAFSPSLSLASSTISTSSDNNSVTTTSTQSDSQNDGNSLTSDGEVTSGTIGSSRVVHLAKRNASSFAIDSGDTASNGSDVYLWTSNPSSASQQWEEINRGGGYYSYQKVGTNFSLDGGNGGTNRQDVYLWVSNSNNYNQQWQKVAVGGGAYKLIKRNAPGFAIDGGDGGAERQNVELFDSSSMSQNQHWIVE